MTMHGSAPFAALPPPPYYAVIFASQRNGDDEAGYARMADRMATLAASQPGYLGIATRRMPKPARVDAPIGTTASKCASPGWSARTGAGTRGLPSEE